MPRVFVCLAVAQLMVLAGTFLLGILSPSITGFRDRHIVAAVFALLLTCLVQVIGFTYLTITGKLAGQAVHLAKLPMLWLGHVKRLKKRFTRLVAVTVLLCILAAATGGNRWRLGPDSWLHGAAACVLLGVMLLVLVREAGVVRENAEMLGQVMAEYNARRRTPSSGFATAPGPRESTEGVAELSRREDGSG